MNASDEIVAVVKDLVTRLVQGRIDDIMAEGRNGRLTRREIIDALANYPGELTLPPDFAYENLHVYDIHDPISQTRTIEFELWYDGEQSDLTLSAKVCAGNDGRMQIKIDDLHVL